MAVVGNPEGEVEAHVRGPTRRVVTMEDGQ